MAKKYLQVTSIQQEIKEVEKKKQKESIKELEEKLEIIEKAFNVKFKKVKKSKGYLAYETNIEGKTVIVGGKEEHYEDKNIIMLDYIRTQLIYAGPFREEGEHYVRVLKSYMTRTRTIKRAFQTKY